MTRRGAPRPPTSPAWTQAIDDWACDLKLALRSPGTVYTRTCHLRRFAEHLTDTNPDADPWTATYREITDWLLTDTQRAPNYQRSLTSSISSFYAWAARTRRIPADQNPALDLPTVHVPPGTPRPAPDDVVTSGIHDPIDPTVGFIVRLAAESGGRRAELAGIHRRDIEGRGDLLRLHGKGRKDRVVPLGPGIALEIRDRLTANSRLPWDTGGWLFPSDRRPGRHITPGCIGKWVSAALGDGWTMHTLRHAFGTALAEDGVPLDVIRDLMGHSSTEITSWYVQRSMELKRQAVAHAAARLTWGPHQRHLRTIPGGRATAASAVAALLLIHPSWTYPRDGPVELTRHTATAHSPGPSTPAPNPGPRNPTRC